MIVFTKIFKIVIILIIVVTVNWGLLAKSLTDDETIEQAIVRLIAVHEADETSHLGVGESLEAHKTADVVDHPIGSIKSDKTTTTEHELYDSFSAIDAWSVTSGTKQQVGYALQINKLYNVGTVADAYASLPFYSSLNFLTKEKLAQFSASFSGSDASRFYAVCFGTYWSSPQDGFGLKVVADGVYLFVDSGGERTLSSKYVVNPLSEHLWRIHFSPLDSLISLYMDGDEIVQLAMPTAEPLDGDTDMNLYISASLATSASLKISNFYFSHQV